MLDVGAQPASMYTDSNGSYSYTALHEAIYCQQPEAVRLLLQRGAQSNGPNGVWRVQKMEGKALSHVSLGRTAQISFPHVSGGITGWKIWYGRV